MRRQRSRAGALLYVLMPVLAAVATSAAPGAPAVDVEGEQRTRYESHDEQFRPSLDIDDEALLFRTNVVVAAAWPRWTLRGELMDSRAALNDSGSLINTTIVNTLEPIQLTLTRSWQHADTVESSLSFGRMTFDLGTRRVIARSRYRNTVTTFMGVDWNRRAADGRVLRAFYLKPFDALPGDRDSLLDNDQALDSTEGHADLVGVYLSDSLPGGAARYEIYGVKFDANEGARRDLVTLGGRVFRAAAPAQLFWDLELVVQTGKSSGAVGGQTQNGLDHSARFVHGELGYRWDADWAPVLSLRLDSASGDEDPADRDDERFDTLFGARRFDYGPTGIFGPFARSNLSAAGLQLAFRPAGRWRGTLTWQRFRLESGRDAWTTTGLRDPSGTAGSSLGRQLEGYFQFAAIPDRLDIELGYTRLTKGSFVDRVSPDRNGTSNYFYAATTISF